MTSSFFFLNLLCWIVSLWALNVSTSMRLASSNVGSRIHGPLTRQACVANLKTAHQIQYFPPSSFWVTYWRKSKWGSANTHSTAATSFPGHFPPSHVVWEWGYKMWPWLNYPGCCHYHRMLLVPSSYYLTGGQVCLVCRPSCHPYSVSPRTRQYVAW